MTVAARPLFLRRPPLAMLAAVTLSLGCADGGKSGRDRTLDGGGDDGGLPFEYALVEQGVAALCAVVFGCPGLDDDAEALLLLRGTVEECEARLSDADDLVYGYPATRLGSVQASLETGRSVVDEEALAACVDGARQCRVPGVYQCLALVQGTVENGEVCAASHECVSGYCDTDESACGGRCAPDTLSFNFTYAQVEPGEPCGTVSQQAGDVEQVTVHTCAPGEVCVPDPESEEDVNGSCEAPGAVGEACAGKFCAAQLICVDGKCRAVDFAEAEGACDLGSETDPIPGTDTLRICDFLAGFDCVNGTCESLTDGALGSPCEVGYHCDEGLSCVFDDVTEEESCAEPLGAGEPCSDDDACRSGVCDDALDECAAACP